MPYQSVISTISNSRQAAREIVHQIGAPYPDLAILFVSHHHVAELPNILDMIRENVLPHHLIGCTGESLIGRDREVEFSPAIVLWTAHLPGVKVQSFHLEQRDTKRLETATAWHEYLGVSPESHPAFIVFPEPFSIDAGACFRKLDSAFPGAIVAGGMASGATVPGQNRLFQDSTLHAQGLVGVSLEGHIQLSSVVSQGCRPIGSLHLVTRAEENLIEELGGRPALEVLQELFLEADEEERMRIQQGLHLGYVVDENLDQFGMGDFLIRNLMGVVEDRGLVISDRIQPGQTVQFHVRDSRSADEEMRCLVETRIKQMGTLPEACLMFSCNGRGTRLFDLPDHDVDVVRSFAPDCEIAGFFAQGEIGPVGKKTFIHGYTTSLLLFHGKQPAGPFD